MMSSLADQLIQFYQQLVPPRMPRGYGILHPQPDAEVMGVVNLFFKKYYDDNNPRHLILGINPGRFGAGITGINFTAPRQLKSACGISHPWKDSSELSAEFIYEVIDQYGGASKFYGDYFIGAVSPLGYVKDGKNINYYDNPQLRESVTPFILHSIQLQLKMGFDRDTCVCIGHEKNFKFLTALNEKNKFFKNIIPLPHPRFIMQYRRKQKHEFISQYLELLKKIASH